MPSPLTPDGSTAVSASDDKTLRVWDLGGGGGGRGGGGGGAIRACAIGPGNVIVTGDAAGRVLVYDLVLPPGWGAARPAEAGAPCPSWADGKGSAPP